MIAQVCGSTPKKSIISAKSISNLEPSETKWLKPTCLLTALSRSALERVALCEIKAMLPSGGIFGKMLALSFRAGLINPRESGPKTLKPYSEDACKILVDK